MINIFEDWIREEAKTALAGFHEALCPGQIGIWSVAFCGGSKTGEPGEKPLDQGGNQQQTLPIYMTLGWN